ncbi:hypothetical protein AB0K09_21055, partial [Streptomyces sp. NPDC049577]|uniref:hypothetical protein n=1 Tax=Streptomyces sp. NPDC049577 TaxID=3155153 RepID=UPI003415F26B
MNSRTVKALAACSPAPGRLDLFLGADDGGVWHKTFDGGTAGTWSPWRPLGRPWPSAGAPGADRLTATVSGAGRIELLALGGDRELWHRAFADGGWGQWTSRGPLTGCSPAVGFTATASGPGDLHVFYPADGRRAEVVHWRPDGRRTPLLPDLRASGRLEAVAVAPGRFDLFLSDARERRFLRGRFTDGRPTVWDDLGNPPGDGRTSHSFTATECDFFVAGGKGLWHRPLDAPPGWENLGGDLTPDGTAPAHVASASWDGDRTDVFAVWAGVAVMHRWYDEAWSDWQLIDVWDSAQGVYSALRPQDLVALTIRSAGLRERVRSDGVVELVADHPGGRLIVDLAPQHTAESVLESGSSSQARTAGPSRLHFAVDQGPIALTVDGILDAMGRLPLVTAPSSAGEEVSRLELPWRLLLALRPGPQSTARCTHRSSPGTGTGGATELWHSRISAHGGDEYLGVQPYQALPGESGLGTPLDGWVDQIAQRGAQHADRPATVDRLIMSSYGAWFSASVSWPELEWTHRTAMGRDYYVRILKRGALFPFGHRAAYVEVVEREFDQTGPAVAGLRRKPMLIVTEPDRDYGIGAGGAHERTFPFQHVAVEPRLVTDLDVPHWLGTWGFWPTRGGSAIEFSLHARAGEEDVELRLPLLFADDTATGTAGATALDTEYARGPHFGAGFDMGRPTTDIGRRIPLAMQSLTQPVQGAVQEVRSMTFGGVGKALTPGGVGFHPKVTQLEVGLPAVRQLLGPMPAIPATFSQALAQAAPGAPAPDALLDLLERKVLNFSAAGARAGLLAAPNMTVDQISRTLGPIAGGQFPTDPRKVFDADAKLFGVVPLRDIISVITGQPKIVWADAEGALSATLTWKEKLTNHVGPFYPGTSSSVFLEVIAKVVDDRPVMHATGEITDFSLEIPARDGALVILTFKKVRFTANSGERLTLSFDLKDAQLTGQLAFIRTLAKSIPQVAGRGLRTDVSAERVKATYTVCVPTTGLIVFTLQNLVLETGLTLSLTNRPIVIDFAFGTRERPFLVTASGFGGGGYLELGVSAGGPDAGLQRFVGGIEFGASVAMNFGVAAGEVHVLGGVVFVKHDGIEITGYLRIGGSVTVLGLIRVSVELTMSLTYDLDANELTGSARLVIT